MLWRQDTVPFPWGDKRAVLDKGDELTISVWPSADTAQPCLALHSEKGWRWPWLPLPQPSMRRLLQVSPPKAERADLHGVGGVALGLLHPGAALRPIHQPQPNLDPLQFREYRFPDSLPNHEVLHEVSHRLSERAAHNRKPCTLWQVKEGPEGSCSTDCCAHPVNCRLDQEGYQMCPFKSLTECSALDLQLTFLNSRYLAMSESLFWKFLCLGSVSTIRLHRQPSKLL